MQAAEEKKANMMQAKASATQKARTIGIRKSMLCKQSAKLSTSEYQHAFETAAISLGNNRDPKQYPHCGARY